MTRMPTIINVHQPQRTEYVTRAVTVHEHRAPTDQSVALLKEMEQAATAKLIDATHIGDTAFECVVHQFLDHASDSTILRAVFSINGKKMTAEHRARPRSGDEEAAAMIGLRDEVAKTIATHMIASTFAAARRNGR